MLDLMAKNVTILSGKGIHNCLPCPIQRKILYQYDVLRSWIMALRVIIEIQVHHQNFFINRLLLYAVRSIKTLEKFANEKVIPTRARCRNLFMPL